MKLDQKIEDLKNLNKYRYISQSEISEIDATGVIMEHSKTKARVFLLLSDDNNKVFTIGFRTPSMNSTGVAHIIEHTVLCGSEKFPGKDPFVELVKGSLNTFLNAMTYPDKTVYPVASCNEKDFRNLCDVYLDAVFHPNIYKEKKIFKQEGWHYEMEDADAELTINGVVYNEMKGVYSSADGVLERSITRALFKDHPYGEESGGDPENIPELTYEDYIDFHKKYYHPTNSFIYLYGDMDMVKELTWMDETYLSKFEELDIDSKIPETHKLKEPICEEYEYSISESETTQKATYLSLHTVVGCELDPIKYMGLQILDYVLLSMPGAPVREALIDAGIGEDIMGGYEYGISMPYFSFIAKNAEYNQKGEFLAVIKGTLRKLANNGLDRESLKAAINVSEFRAREADFGSYPKGLMYGLESFNSWLYGGDPMMHLRFQHIFDTLKEQVDRGFFEQLIKDYLLDNLDEAVVILKPVIGLTEKRDDELKAKLKFIRDKLSKEQRETIVTETAQLKEYQSEPTKKEDMLKIPILKREDISVEAERLVWKKLQVDTVPLIYSDIFTSGIAYIKVVFKADFLAKAELPYLALLSEVVGYIDTKEHTYAKLATLTNLNSGGIGYSLDSYGDFENIGEVTYTFAANAKVLYNKIPFALDSIKEMLIESRLDDIKRLKDILAEVKAKTKGRLTSSGHVVALSRAGSHISKDAYFSDSTKGVLYYSCLEKISAAGEDEIKDLSDKLISLSKRLFTKDNMILDIICDDEGYEVFEKYAIDFCNSLPETAQRDMLWSYEPDKESEGLTSASQVNYVARYGNFINHGFSYTGVLKILKVILSYDYLWNNVRVKGGAYGCSSVFGRSGNSGFTSYRDPNITQTDKIYDGITEFVRNFDADEREMTKTIIGAISELDTPLTPLNKGLRGLAAYFSHVSDEDLQKERDEILKADAEDIRALVPIIESILLDGLRCVIGNEKQIKESSEIFSKISPLYND